MKHIKKIVPFILPVVMLVLPLAFTMAQVTIPTDVPAGRAITLGEIIAIIRRIAQVLTTIGVVIGVIYIIYGGILYMTSGDDTKKAKAVVTNGLIGVAIVLGVGVLIQTVSALVTRSFFDTGTIR